MKHGFILAALMAVSCGGDTLSSAEMYGSGSSSPPRASSDTPAATTPADTISRAASGWLWLMAVDGRGVCIENAGFEIVSGQGAGLTRTQSANCDAWSYDGGYMLYGLVPGSPMKIRASATGYLAVEKTVVPNTGGGQATQFVLVQ